MKKLMLIVCMIIGLAGVGCMSLSSYLTPADINPQAVRYVEDANVASMSYTGWANLYKAESLKNDVTRAYKKNQLTIKQVAERNNSDYEMYAQVTTANYTAAVEREEAIFGQEGALTGILALTGFSGAAGLIGLMRKRPGDVTKEELTGAVSQATGMKEEELNAKITQFEQVVKSIEKFKTSAKVVASTDTTTAAKVDELLKVLKTACNETQDTNTQVAVATTLKTSA